MLRASTIILGSMVFSYTLFFLYIAATTFPYILIIKDDLTGYLQLSCHRTNDSNAVIQALSDWAGHFGTPRMLVSDRGSHFTDMVLGRLTKQLQVKHHFTSAYSPKSNGVVERANRDVLNAITFTYDNKLPQHEYNKYLNMIQHRLNNISRKSLNGLTPAQVFIGREPTMLPHIGPMPENLIPNYVEDIYKSLVQTIDEMTMEARSARLSARERSRKYRAGQPHHEFKLGYLVLVHMQHRVNSKIRPT